MSEYTASNGIKVTSETQPITGYWRINFETERTGERIEIAGNYMKALIEALDHERDEELGRWRWPENPDYVVYPRGDHVQVVNEASGNALGATREQSGISTGLSNAAAAYFEAHPERKPWEDAKVGEVWAVKESGQPERAYMVDDSQFYDSSRDYALNFDDSLILEARRIWPEGDAP